MDNEVLVSILCYGLGALLGMSFFIAGIYVLRKNAKNKKCKEMTYGTVVNNIQKSERDTDDRIRYVWHSLVEYEVGGTKCARETMLSSQRPRYEIGDKVEVYYNSQNVHEAYIKGDTYPNFIAFMLWLFAILSVVMSVLLKISILS